MRQERTIRKLLNPGTKVYLWFSTMEAGQAFLEQAEREGFTFADGTLPTGREPDDLLAIHDDLTISYLGFAGRMAYKMASESGGKLHVRIDYDRYRSGEANYFVDLQVGEYAGCAQEEPNSKDSISSGTAAIIVYDDDLRDQTDFFDWLKAEGFYRWAHAKGWFDGVCWVYVNINSKRYAPGIPGIPITQAFGFHAVTIPEFREIYGIFKKYERLSPLRFKVRGRRAEP